MKFYRFEQLSLNSALVLVPTWFNEGLRILVDVEGVIILSSHNPLGFHD